jgi:hypothetical protein
VSYGPHKYAQETWAAALKFFQQHLGKPQGHP